LPHGILPATSRKVFPVTDEAPASQTPGTAPSSSGRQAPPEIDTTVPHSARIWNYWLGGKDNYPVDRQAGDEFREIFPGIVDAARAVRHFLARAVRHLAGDVGIRQFLDIGTGLPTVDNTHEIAQRVAPDTRIVYVDNDRCKSRCSHALTPTPYRCSGRRAAVRCSLDRVVVVRRSGQ
jgi:hypothetical protein